MISNAVEQIFYYRTLGLYETATIKFNTCDIHEYLKMYAPMEIANNKINIQLISGLVSQIFTLRD